MSIRDWLPWRSGGNDVPVRREGAPPSPARDRMNQLFDEVFQGFEQLGVPGGASFLGPLAELATPSVDVRETDEEVIVTAEVPGMEASDVEVQLDRDHLVLRGEKTLTDEQREGDFYRMERRFGAFDRRIPLPAEVETEGVEARCRNGVLEVILRKVPGSGARRVVVRSRD